MLLVIIANSNADSSYTETFTREPISTLPLNCTVGPGQDLCYTFIYVSRLTQGMPVDVAAEDAVISKLVEVNGMASF